MMRILFVDDNAERHFIFKEWLQEREDIFVDYVFTYEYACDKILEEYDVLCLDHDLSIEDQMCTPGGITKEKTGSDLATFIVNHLDYIKKPVCIVHSYNPLGAKRMLEIFKDKDIHAIYVPFGTSANLYKGLGDVGK